MPPADDAWEAIRPTIFQEFITNRPAVADVIVEEQCRLWEYLVQGFEQPPRCCEHCSCQEFAAASELIVLLYASECYLVEVPVYLFRCVQCGAAGQLHCAAELDCLAVSPGDLRIGTRRLTRKPLLFDCKLLQLFIFLRSSPHGSLPSFTKLATSLLSKYEAHGCPRVPNADEFRKRLGTH